jgi:hypothetical protein
MTDQPATLGDVARIFFKIGAMSYGGPAIMGIMQTEVQEKRQWLSKQQFVEGLALVNMLPGPGAAQLGILLGHTKAGGPGGGVAGICFILPAREPQSHQRSNRRYRRQTPPAPAPAGGSPPSGVRLRPPGDAYTLPEFRAGS